MTDSYIIRHEQCPECRKQGRDNGKDNLGVYSDGHMYCYSCGYYVPGSAITKYKSAKRVPEVKQLVLPYDVTPVIRPDALEWFYSYGLDQNAVTKHTLLWSPSREMLIFPYFIDGVLVGWQGRLFGEDKAKRKWFTQGDVDNIIYILGRQNKEIVLVESIVSAIKVSRVAQVCPIMGSHISNNRLLRLNRFHDTIILWLDPDKRKECIKIADRAQLLGMTTKIIYSDMKPKDYTIDEIERYING